MKIGDTIRKLRRERNWSQSDLAAALEESRQSVVSWESGDSLPELDRLIHMSLVFEVPMDELLGEEKAAYDLCPEKDPGKEAEKRKKDRLLLMLKLLGVGILVLMGIIINMVWLKFIGRFFS